MRALQEARLNVAGTFRQHAQFTSIFTLKTVKNWVKILFNRSLEIKDITSSEISVVVESLKFKLRVP